MKALTEGSSVTASAERPSGRWQELAACRGMDTRLFFPDRGESAQEAEEACRACSVSIHCAEYAISTGQRFGVWGGTSERQRRRIRASRSGQAGRLMDGAA